MITKDFKKIASESFLVLQYVSNYAMLAKRYLISFYGKVHVSLVMLEKSLFSQIKYRTWKLQIQ